MKIKLIIVIMICIYSTTSLDVESSAINLVHMANVGTESANLDVSESQENLTSESVQKLTTPVGKKQLVIQGVDVDGTYITQGPKEVIGDVSSTLSDGAQQRKIDTLQFVVAERYMDGYGNLSDVVEQIKKYEIPDRGSLFRADIDVFDWLTRAYFRSYLNQHKRKTHLKAVILEKTTLEYMDVVPGDGTGNPINYREDNIEKFGMLKLKQRTSFKETTISNNTEIITRVKQESQSSFLLNASELPGKYSYLQQEHSGAMLSEKVQQINFEHVQVSTGLEPNDEFSLINKKALMEQIPDSVRQLVPGEDLIKLLNSAQPYAETHHSTIQSTTTKSTQTNVTTGSQNQHSLGSWELGWLSGINVEESVTTSTNKRTLHVVEQSLENVDLFVVRESTGAVTPELVDKLGGTVLREADIELPEEENTTVKQGKFKDGLISYAPFVGGFIHLGVKYDLGGSITTGDLFWVAMDAVEIVVLIVTVGTSTPFTVIGKTFGKIGVKTAMKAGAKTVAKTGAKQIGKNISRYSIKGVSKGIVRETGQEFIESGTKKIVTKNSITRLINYKYAGQTFPLEKIKSPIVREHLQKNYPNSVKFNKNGYPDFSPYTKKTVKLDNLTGNHAKDAILSNKKAGLDNTPEGYLWHHNQDMRTMQLVPKDLHEAIRHTGGASKLKKLNS